MTAANNARVLDFDMQKPSKKRAAALNQTRNSDDFLQQLKSLLQTTIELPDLLQIFFEEIAAYLKLDGLDYDHQLNQYQSKLGDTSGHASYYRLQTQTHYLGELAFYRNKNKFTYAELKILEGAIGSLVYPLRNALQYHQAVRSALTDPLTGAGNRMYMDDVLTRELDQAHRYNQALSVLMIDVDHFKTINDTYGHAAGDEVLKQLANTMKQSSRCADMTFRYGGEEFVLLLNKTSLAGAGIIAERLRSTIEAKQFTYDDLEIPVTISIGIASIEGSENKESLFKRADAALYKAKVSGRNQVQTATPERPRYKARISL